MAVSLPHNWTPREYQSEYFQYMFKNGEFPTRARAQLVWHRRAGKDSTSINTLAPAAHLRVGTYWHMLPTLNQARKVVWNGVDADGRRIIKQAFPEEIIESINENDMLVRFKNGSFYQVVGSDNYDSLVGTNPLGVVFSEWSIADPRAWDFVRPILNENGGFATFIYTPRGRNHAHTMWKMAQNDPKWFTSLKTIRDTRRQNGTPVITEEDIEQERKEGVPEEIIQQEYYCSFEGINFGSVYGRYLKKYEANQIVFPQPYNPDFVVFTAWDLGRRDAAAVWFYQLINNEVHIVDYDEDRGLDADEWLDRLATNFEYPLGIAALPHDAKARTFSSKYTTEEIFIGKKMKTYVVKNMPRAHGINAVRALLPKVYFNIGNPNVRKGIDRLENYKYEYDDKLKVFTQEPLHDDNSHGSDAFRMLALSANVMDMSHPTGGRLKAGPKHFNTILGKALNLERLFAERDEASKRNQGRI